MKIAVIPPFHKFDYLAATVIEGLQKYGVDIVASDLGNGITVSVDENRFIKEAQDADWIFAVWGKQPGKLHLLEKIDRWDKTIYIDGSEWTCKGHKDNPRQHLDAKKDPKRRRGSPWVNEYMLGKCAYYFKRECYPEDKGRGIYPLPFGTLDDFFVNRLPKKDIDIFCSFSHCLTGLRAEIKYACKELEKSGANVVIDSGLPFDKYKEFTSRSHICVDAWGAGDCNARLFEIIAMGSACAYQKWNIEFPYKFKDDYEIIGYSSVDEFYNKMDYYLKNRKEIQEITKRGYRKLLDFHTSYRRVEYIFDIISE